MRKISAPKKYYKIFFSIGYFYKFLFLTCARAKNITVHANQLLIVGELKIYIQIKRGGVTATFCD